MNRHRILVVAAATLSAALWGPLACGDGGTEPPPPDPPRPTTVTVTPATAELTALGATVQLQAQVLDQYGQVMAGAAVSWSSSAASVAAVDGSGLVTAAANGAATITATAGSASGSASGTAAVTVAQQVSTVEVSPAADTVVERDTVRFGAEARDANGHAVAGAEFTWASGDTSVAVVDASGLVTGRSAGEVAVTATSSGVTGRGALVVEEPVPTTVSVAPDSLAFTALGDTLHLMAEVRDQIDRVMEGEPVAWTSADTMVAAVDASGLVTAAANGAATITATAGSASGTAAVTVAQTVSTVEVSPAADTVVERDTVRFDAEAVDANGHAVAGAEFTWASGDTSVAVVDTSGLVTGRSAGEVAVTATSSGVTGRGALVVEEPVPTTVSVAPDSLAFTALGDTLHLMAEVRDQIDRVMEGEPVAWTSADTMVAAVDAAGLVTAAANGVATITATAGSASGTAAVTVAQTVSTVEVSPAADTVVERDTVRFDAEAVDANGHAVAGAEFTWASGDTSVAVVDTSGLVTGTSAGEVAVTATSSGVTGRAQLTVVVPAPTTVAVTPGTLAFTALGQTMQLAAEVLDQAGRVMEDEPVAWSSADTMVAAVDSVGLVTAAGSGATVVTATAGSASGEAAVTVMQSARSVVVSPASAAIALGDTLRLAAEAVDENGNAVAGAAFAWSSSDASVARVGASGLVNGVGEGTVTITATTGSAVGTSEITVDNPDRAALVALYHATDGPNWLNNENWLTDAPLGDWYGVDVDASGRVTSLDLSGRYDQVKVQHGLAGPIPPELGNLTRLRTLDLTLNALTGPIPPEFGNLSGLRELLLEVNALDGPIPQWIGDLPNLRNLSLGNNELTGPIPPELGTLGSLERLHLNQFTAIGSLNIYDGTLSYNSLTGPIPPELGNLANLRELLLGNNRLTGPVPPELGGLTSLQYLDLYNNALSGPIPPELGNLTSLAALRLANNALEGPIPPELGNLTSLAALRLANNALEGPIPPELGNLTSLAALRLANNALEGPIPPELGNLTSLAALRLANNALEGPIPPELGNLTSLAALRLANNALEGPIPRSFLQLVTLEWFQFEENNGLCAPQTTEFTSWFSGMDRYMGPFCNEPDVAVLESLYQATAGADWTNSQGWLGDGAVSEWHGVSADSLGRVTGLDLSRNRLVGRLTPAIAMGELARMAELRINGNALSGRLPLSLARLSLRELHYGDTELCTPPDGSFQEWLDAIPSHSGTGVECAPLSNRDILVTLYEATDGPNWARSDNWLSDKPLSMWYGVWSNQGGGAPQLQAGPSPDGSHRVTDDRPPDILAPDSAGQGDERWPVPDNGPQDRVAAESFGWRPVSSMADGNVVHLYLGRNNLTGVIPAELGNLANLERLNLRNNDLAGSIPGELGNLANLERLNLRNNDLAGPIPGELGNLASLDSLTLYFNKLSGPIPPQLGRLGSLRFLGLDGNPLGGTIPPELGNLANLEKLSLVRTDLQGTIPPELGNLSSLWEMRLFWNDLTGEIPPELGNLANLKDLVLSGNQLTGEIPPELGNLSNLEYLSVTVNTLTGPIPGELANLSNLEVLALGGNNFTTIPPEFSNFSSLQELYLWGNDLAGPIPPELGSLASLEILYLADADLTGSIPPELGGLASLRELHVWDNAEMSGALPVGLTALGRLEVLLTGGTDLCVPADVPRLQEWLGGVAKHRVARCGAAVAYLTQAVQSREFPVPLVADEDALLRVFVTATHATAEGIPPVRASFYVGGAETHVVDIPGQSAAIPTEVDEGTLSKSANIEIPGEVLRPGLEMVIEIDPMGTLDSGLVVTRRIPETGRASLDVKAMPTLDLTLIPFLWQSEPDSSILEITRTMAADPERHELLWDTRTLLPIGDLDVKAHEPVLVSTNNAHSLLYETRVIRVVEGGTGHYMGMMPYRGTGPTGVGYVPGKSTFSVPAAGTMAHELGHNLSLQHAPCNDPANPDPSFPSPIGSIGAWGYDFRDGGSLVSPHTADLMSYCDPHWISDFYFGNALRFRLSDADSVGLPDLGPPTQSLLLWGGVGADSVPFLEPAFVVDAPPVLPRVGGEYRLTGRTGGGEELFSLGFAMPEIADGDGSSSFAFAFPAESEWADALAAITLSGPGGSVTLDADSDLSVTILRNPRTGQVRGILRDLPDPAQARAAAFAAGPGLEVLFSSGIPGAEAWRR